MVQVPLPPKNAKRLKTVCQFCIVGCGYNVYKWPEGKDGGTAPSENALEIDFRKQLDAFSQEMLTFRVPKIGPRGPVNMLR